MLAVSGTGDKLEIIKPDCLIEAKNLTKVFTSGGGILNRKSKNVYAVGGVNLSIIRGESIALVGESGCGKTTIARMLVRLIEPTSGTLLFNGEDLLAKESRALRSLRTKMQIVFQDPQASLNPRKNIIQILSKPFQIHTSMTAKEIKNRVWNLLEDVGLVPAEQFIYRYPHELSGGQRQRIVIARAIALKPDLVIADEPVSALDVSMRGQILNLLVNLRKDYELTYLFITHDLSIVRSICDRVAVMYLGRIVELGSTEDVFSNPFHPYTRALLGATPVPDPIEMKKRQRQILVGEVPSAVHLPTGCYFHPRCPFRSVRCDSEYPVTREIKSNHFAACHYADQF